MKPSAKPIQLDSQQAGELRECLELLNAIELIEFHNKNWLPVFALQSPSMLNREKRALIERALSAIGGSTARQSHT